MQIVIMLLTPNDQSAGRQGSDLQCGGELLVHGLMRRATSIP